MRIQTAGRYELAGLFVFVGGLALLSFLAVAPFLIVLVLLCTMLVYLFDNLLAVAERDGASFGNVDALFARFFDHCRYGCVGGHEGDIETFLLYAVDHLKTSAGQDRLLMTCQAHRVDSLRQHGLETHVPESFERSSCLVFGQEPWMAGRNEVRAGVPALETLTVKAWAMMRWMPSSALHPGSLPLTHEMIVVRDEFFAGSMASFLTTVEQSWGSTIAL